MNIERQGKYGVVTVENTPVLSFEVQGIAESNISTSNIYEKYMNEYNGIRIKDFIIPAWGDNNNLYPQAVYSLISQNKLIPQLLEKQVEYLFGKGYYLYKEKIDGKEIIKEPIENIQVIDWLESWEGKGLTSVSDYLLQLIQEYYHIPAVASKYRFAKSRLISLPGAPSKYASPIIGLEAVPLDEIRLGTKDLNINRRIKDSDCNHILVGDWLNPSRQSFDVYDRFNPSAPFSSNTTIAFVKNKSFTKNIYPLNRWYEGNFDWIKGANLTPKFINSYLKNALNARIHVLIPGTWVERQRSILQTICESNMSEETLQGSYKGVNLLNNNGEPLRYVESMIEQLINKQLQEITRLMAGEGKNQGKLWASIKYSMGNVIEEWEFKEIPSNYKDFIDALTNYDKRADQVVLAGIGINSSISNVEKDGVISKSGSDVFYNYMIYINSLSIPEYYVCKEINRAIALNFPDAKCKLGFYHRVPDKTSEISQNQRMEETVE